MPHVVIIARVTVKEGRAGEYAAAFATLLEQAKREPGTVIYAVNRSNDEDLTASCWNPAVFLDPAYWAELQRRNALEGHPVNLDSYRQPQPALFPLLKVPPSAECGQDGRP
jgi:hypothetical protein